MNDSDRNPSGISRGRIIRPVYGSSEQDVDARLPHEHAGLLRSRTVILAVCGLLVALVVVLLIAGNGDAAAGVAALLLAPLVLVLAGIQVAVALTQPRG